MVLIAQTVFFVRAQTNRQTRLNAPPTPASIQPAWLTSYVFFLFICKHVVNYNATLFEVGLGLTGLGLVSVSSLLLLNEMVVLENRVENDE